MRRVCECVNKHTPCVFITAGPIIKLCAGCVYYCSTHAKKKVFSVHSHPVRVCFSFDQANPGGVILPHQDAMICVGLLLLLLCVQTSPTLSFIVIAQSGVIPVGSGKVLKEARPFFAPLSITEARRGREAAVCISMQVYPAKL